MARRHNRLELCDYDGRGPPAVLLHGLAGSGREWETTAAWLSATHRVLASDQRGHGRSERRPKDLSRDAFVSDVVGLLEELELAPAALVGQSLGGHTAFLVAARRPDLVAALVVAEASPSRTSCRTVAAVRDWLASWPVPFASLGEARAFFGGETVAARAWASGLEQSDGDWWPSFDVDVLVRALSATAERSYWSEWRRIDIPTLVVRGARGSLSDADARAMVGSCSSARLVVVPGAGHDVHLEAPLAWRKAVEGFLANVGA